MSKRKLQFALVFAAALIVTPMLPLYVERTMLRSWQTDQTGDLIAWGWALVSLDTFWRDYPYLAPEQQPTLWLGVNVALAIAYALIIALAVDFIRFRRAR